MLDAHHFLFWQYKYGEATRSGGIVDQPHEILRSFCKNFVEMEFPGKDNICCGGGGGAVSIDEIRPYRMNVGGRAKAEQIRQTGAKYVVAHCANCKKQLKELIETHKLGCELVRLHDLIYMAIIFPDQNDSADNQ